ncbi:hypothetical protein [Enterobacter cloacae complex sp. ESBL7]|uniref:hypothetical protein n=1 Tax=Enterobacter cloacae complex sp. ESBL7 TaxID=3163325 RepID=UPI0035631076
MQEKAWFNKNVIHAFPLDIEVNMRKTVSLIVSFLPMYGMANSFDLPTVHSIKNGTQCEISFNDNGHFQSTQYKRCGAGGMEVSGRNPQPPGYGWNESLFSLHPEYTPIGILWAFENKGLSGHGGNRQVTSRKKGYIIFPSVLAAMEYKVDYINRNGGNWARWHSRDPSVQEYYRTAISKMRHPFIDEINKEDK